MGRQADRVSIKTFGLLTVIHARPSSIVYLRRWKGAEVVGILACEYVVLPGRLWALLRLLRRGGKMGPGCGRRLLDPGVWTPEMLVNTM